MPNIYLMSSLSGVCAEYLMKDATHRSLCRRFGRPEVRHVKLGEDVGRVTVAHLAAVQTAHFLMGSFPCTGLSMVNRRGDGLGDDGIPTSSAMLFI